MKFDVDSTVWAVKQRILCTLSQSLKDVLNYGLFQPANNGRDGKFLDEERLLSEYPQPASKSIPTLEVKKKGNCNCNGLLCAVRGNKYLDPLPFVIQHTSTAYIHFKCIHIMSFVFGQRSMHTLVLTSI